MEWTHEILAIMRFLVAGRIGMEWTHEILAIIRFLVAENRRTFDGVEKWVSVMLPISHTMAS
jgi:hypothetical protein